MLLTTLALMLTLAGCGAVKQGNEAERECKEIVDWVDFIQLNDITYHHNYDGTTAATTEQLGNRIGEITYMLNDHACSNHKNANGDAAFLPIGTPIYAMKGYKEEYRIIADNKIYEADRNPHAATVSELWDIAGKVDKVSLNSGQDGSHLGDFSKEMSSAFMEELLLLELVGFNKVYKQTKHESGIFLRVHLNDGTSFRMVFYPKANAFTAGMFGTEKLKEIIMTEQDRIKAGNS
ncbi:hypothetical protein [Paenibacillus swuensis]|uniref:hypothetical protein n=1 Tax=Paenibacillus swuensis TaxID=1178515 RepID=UPI001E31C961|nr:hypothetical protein [Paenibacillus swuensis]